MRKVSFNRWPQISPDIAMPKYELNFSDLLKPAIQCLGKVVVLN